MSRRTAAALALLATAGAWGATFTLIKDVLAKIAPEPFIFYRFTIAGVILLIAALVRRRLTRRLLRPAITLGILVFAGYWLQTRGLMAISPARSALLTGLYVILVPFCERVLYRTRVPLHAWTASVAALAGTALLIGGFEERPTLGDAMTVGCAALFAFHVILSARYSVQHSATGLAAVQVLVVGLAAGPVSLFAPRPVVSAAVVTVILFTAVVTTAIAFAALMWAQAHVTATQAAVILAFEPVAATITSVLWGKQALTLPFIAGAALIVGAMIVSQLPDRPSATMHIDAADPGHQ